MIIEELLEMRLALAHAGMGARAWLEGQRLGLIGGGSGGGREVRRLVEVGSSI